jgi:hypothetical protein
MRETASNARESAEKTRSAPKSRDERATRGEPCATVGAMFREIAANFTLALADYFRRVASNDAQYASSKLSCSWFPSGRHSPGTVSTNE